MRHIKSFNIPKQTPETLVADAGPDIPGGEGANKGFWRQQWRDRLKRFAKMGRSIRFTLEIDGVLKSFIGRFKGASKDNPNLARVLVKGDPDLPDGYYYVDSDNGEMIVATLSDSRLKKLGIGRDDKNRFVPMDRAKSAQRLEDIIFEPLEGAESEEPRELKNKMTGAEVQARKMSTVYENLREEGRFPVPRQTTSDHWGKNSDIAEGAKEDYNLVYEKLKDSDPEIAKKYPTFDDFWKRVESYSVGQTSQSPNDLSEIPQEMKDINKAYAQHVLGLTPDGKITYYRNAVNQKGTPEESALGYATTNADFAYDYNSQAPNINGNGRYEIDVQPDEVFGMLGYSQLEDEFGIVIGRGVTSQPDRVRRVGDLEQPKMAPWLEKYQDGVGRSTGGTPYRHFALAGQFDFLPVDPLGENANDFLEKHGKTAADIRIKFDELYGEGAYEAYKASDNTLAFSDIKKLFVDAGNGKVGLDITKIDGGEGGFLAPAGYGDASNPESFENDRVDNTLKMLSVFQELTGQPFMVHRDNPRNKELASDEDYEQMEAELDVPEEPQAIQSIQSLYENEPEQSLFSSIRTSFDTDHTHTDEEYDALEWFTDGGYDYASQFLREGKEISDRNRARVDSLLNLIEQSDVTNGAIIYRGRPILEEDTWNEVLSLKAGDILLDKGIGSHSQEDRRAEFYYNMNLGDKTYGRVFYRLSLKGGEKAFIIPDDASTYGASEKEVILPPNTQYKITAIYDHFGDRVLDVEVVSQKGVDLEKTEEAPETQEVPAATEAELDSLFSYRKEGYKGINKYLRDDSPDKKPSPKKDALIADIDALIEKQTPTTEERIVYRGLSGPAAERLRNSVKGDVLTESGFSSTSTDQQVMWSFAYGTKNIGAELHLTLPAGSKFINVDDYIPENLGPFEIARETEALLPRGLKFRVDSVEDSQINATVILESESESESTPEPEKAPEPAAPTPSSIPKPKPINKPVAPKPISTPAKAAPDVSKVKPVYETFNYDEPDLVSGNGKIIVPDSEAARELSKIGRDATREEIDKLQKKTRSIFSNDPDKYVPFEPKGALTPEQQEMLNTLTPEGQAAFAYVDSSLTINKGLRDGDPMVEYGDQVQNLDKAMLVSEYLEPGMTVYRMVKLSRWEKFLSKGLAPGKILYDEAFLSTSHTKAFSDEAREIDEMTGDINQIPMRIVMPNNTAGLDLSSISWYDTEDEYLLPRNTALRFLGWDSNGYAVFERLT